MSTSKLQRRVSELLSTYLGKWTIRENYRPDWLEGLELDFYVEEIETAIEVQGNQHYQFVEMFHISYDGFRAQLDRDRRKRELCTGNNVILYEICGEAEVILIIGRLAGIEIEHETHPNALEQERQWKEERAQQRFESIVSHKHVKRWIWAIEKFRSRIAATRPDRDISCFLTGINNRKEKIRRRLDYEGYDSELIDEFIVHL